jgi:hypothetical protein
MPVWRDITNVYEKAAGTTIYDDVSEREPKKIMCRRNNYFAAMWTTAEKVITTIQNGLLCFQRIDFSTWGEWVVQNIEQIMDVIYQRCDASDVRKSDLKWSTIIADASEQ